MTTQHTPLAQHSTAFALADARTTFFPQKADYLAYRDAWKALARTRTPQAPWAFAAHAILTGRDLHRAFSASRRGGQPPYGALARALRELAWGAHRFPALPADTTVFGPEQFAVLQRAAALVSRRLKAQGFHTDATQSSVADGQGAFAVALEA